MRFNYATKHGRAELPSPASHRPQLAGEDRGGDTGAFVTVLQTSLPLLGFLQFSSSLRFSGRFAERP